jgi:hypothetical protein
MRLPLANAAAIEPRQSGAAPKLVLDFTTPPVAIDGSINCGQEIQITNGSCTSVAISGKSLVIDASFNRNACVTAAVANLIDLTGDTDVQFVTLEGDVATGPGVNLLDLQAVKSVLFQPVAPGSFLSDVNVDGSINLLDLQVIKGNLFTAAGCQ